MALNNKDLPGLNFEFWLTKAIEWEQTTTLESQRDVCVHLPKLQQFLMKIHETLKHMNFTAAIKRFPLIGQLLGRLCWNPFVAAFDESQRTLVWCLCCLYSKDPQNPLELKANKWIKNLLCHLFSFPDAGSKEACSFLHRLGCTPSYYYSELLNNMVSSLVTELGELRGNQLNRPAAQGRLLEDRVKDISVLCVPLITMTDVTPLLESLLTYHGYELREILSVHFLEAVNEAFIQKKIALSESAVLVLWLRHLPSLEAAALHLIESLLSSEGRSLEEMEHIIDASLLPRAACHPSIFGVVEEMFKNALLETDGSLKVLTIIRLFTRCFVQVHQKDNGQQKIPLKAYFRYCHPSLVVALLQNPCDMPSTIVCPHLKVVSDMLKLEVEAASTNAITNPIQETCLHTPTGDPLYHEQTYRVDMKTNV
ncbi:Fanconi anemia group C protein isoform X2 [Ambystoma mexicanum]|uniref:Fanconi anemia group C protein isoform X2 n=1 Tax=Ambystoma mexicanum TaxID=8296 RepID=UPI0037E8295D